jgi:PBP1b-binding outer membrane lipoprotein LpoB
MKILIIFALITLLALVAAGCSSLRMPSVKVSGEYTVQGIAAEKK